LILQKRQLIKILNGLLLIQNYKKYKKLTKDLDTFEEYKQHTIVTACLIMARNSIVAKNKKLERVMEKVTSNKAQYFDKALATIVNNCIEKVHYHEAENVIFTLINQSMTMEVSSTPNHKYDYLLDFDVDSITAKEPQFSKQEEELLDIIYQREQEKPTKEEEKSTTHTFHTQPTVSLVNKILNELDKLNNRLFIIGLLGSIILCFIVYKFLQKSGRKTIPPIPSQHISKNARKSR
jgi:hypothetical protein